MRSLYIPPPESANAQHPYAQPECAHAQLQYLNLNTPKA
jgi:hypothetical protein